MKYNFLYLKYLKGAFVALEHVKKRNRPRGDVTM